MHKDFIPQNPKFQISKNTEIYNGNFVYAVSCAKPTNNFNFISFSLTIQQVVKPFSQKPHKHYKLS